MVTRIKYLEMNATMVGPSHQLVRMATILSVWTVCLVACGRAAEIGQDFRGNPFDPKLFLTTGPNAAASMKSDNRGLRITLTEEHGVRPAVGIAASGIKGDFEITMAFDVLKVDPPVAGNGAGVSIWIKTVSYTQEAATIWWACNNFGLPVGEADAETKPKFAPGYCFKAHRAWTEADGKRMHEVGDPLLTQSTSGRLRLVREGSTLYYRVAEGTSDVFSEIFEADIGEEDLQIVRFAADNGGSATLVDAVISEVKITCDDAGAPDVLPPRPSRWPWVVGFGLVVLGVGGGYWFWSRR